jgi:ketosteroid isomerase-like protein
MPVFATAEEDARIVAELDTAYQAAIERNDADAAAKFYHDDFTLVNGYGTVSHQKRLLDRLRTKEAVYSVQRAVPGTQKVRVFGDTAVVTALLEIKAVIRGNNVDTRLWFSDTYVRTPTGWKYFFGQASIALPPNLQKS